MKTAATQSFSGPATPTQREIIARITASGIDAGFLGRNAGTCNRTPPAGVVYPELPSFAPRCQLLRCCMNLPNLLTLSRVPGMFLIVAFMYARDVFPWARWTDSVAFWLFIGGAVSDGLDGYFARKRGIVSDFGKLMDALTDKIMVVGLAIAFVDKGEFVSVPLALIVMCREFIVTGLRAVAAANGTVVAADKGGKTKTVTQLIALGFLLAGPMVRNDWATVVSWWGWWDLAFYVEEIGRWGFVAGTFFAVWSGWRYVEQHRRLVFSDIGR
jgi:CDP-diacylglycerol--glycerol-3-phosphate 3-phosphatidyltransferase